MSETYSVSLAGVMQDGALETIYMPKPPEEIVITSRDVHRPGLFLSGYPDHFNSDRLQILGRSECGYLDSLDDATRVQHLRAFLAHQPPAIIIARGMDIPADLEAGCREFGVALLRTPDTTSEYMASLIAYLNVQLAPRITRHGVLVEVYGEGILLLGDSGVGKSETAIELVKRGHRLIADDAVEIRRVSSKTLVGSAPENIRHFIELRGIGIVNARRIFGIGAVKVTEKIDMAILLEPWDSNKVYDRMGLNSETADILGIQIPKMTIPVKPGRNLAIIIEVAAMNNRQKKMGYNAAEELMHRLGMEADGSSPVTRGEWEKF